MQYKKISVVLVFVSLAWLLFSAIAFFTEWVRYERLEQWANIIELTIAAVAAAMLFWQYHRSKSMFTLAIFSAIFCWTLRELFWFSYVNIANVALPYPSVGDFGFLGFYFFMAGALSQIKSRNRHVLIFLVPILIILIPGLMALKQASGPGVLILNIIFLIAIAFVSFQALLRYSRGSKTLFIAILLFALNDLIFFVEVNTKDYTFLCDMLYPLSLAFLAYGTIKAGESYD